MNLSGRAAVVRPADASGAQRSGAWIVDHAIRALAAGCAEQGRPLPGVGAVILGLDALSLRLTSPDTTPPPGWSLDHDGRTWQTPLRRLDAIAVDVRLPGPLPLLVSIGDLDDGRVLLNLAAADGVISLTGDSVLATRLAGQWSRRLAASPWTGQAQVVQVGFAAEPGFAGLAVDRLVHATPVLGRPEGGVILFAAHADQRDLHQAGQLLTAARRWAVVAVDAERPAWRLTVGLDGTVDTGLFREAVHPRW